MSLHKNDKPLKRFIICLLKQEEGKLGKKVEIVQHQNEMKAVEQLCNRHNIPQKKVSRYGNNEGYLYVNEVYNPIVADEQEV